MTDVFLDSRNWLPSSTGWGDDIIGNFNLSEIGRTLNIENKWGIFIKPDITQRFWENPKEFIINNNLTTYKVKLLVK
jgi:hypothetical protein